MTDTMSKALEAATDAIVRMKHNQTAIYGPREYAEAAISAYLAHLAEDEAVVERLSEVIADALSMNRAGRLEHDAALAALRTLTGKE